MAKRRNPAGGYVYRAFDYSRGKDGAPIGRGCDSASKEGCRALAVDHLARAGQRFRAFVVRRVRAGARSNPPRRMKPETLARRRAERAAADAAARLTIDEAETLCGISPPVKVRNWDLVCGACGASANLFRTPRSAAMAFTRDHADCRGTKRNPPRGPTGYSSKKPRGPTGYSRKAPRGPTGMKQRWRPEWKRV